MCDICDARAKGLSESEAMAEYQQNTMDTIHLYGLALTGVTDAEPPFIYSAGRTLLDLPELYMVGYTDIRNFVATISEVHRAQVEDGLHVHDGGRLAGFLENGHKLAVIAADPVKAEMNTSVGLFREMGREVKAFQLVWPDPEGRYPWDDGYDREEWIQPLYPVG